MVKMTIQITIKNGKRMKSSRYRKPQNLRKDNLSSKTVANYFLSTTISPSKSITRTTLTKLTIQHSLVPRNRLGNIRNGRYYLGDRFSIVETVINVASKGEKIAKTAQIREGCSRRLVTDSRARPAHEQEEKRTQLTRVGRLTSSDERCVRRSLSSRHALVIQAQHRGPPTYTCVCPRYVPLKQ